MLDRILTLDPNNLDARLRYGTISAAIGDFDPDRPGLEVWCRSRFDEHQAPFVFDAHGDLIEHYEMDDVAPVGWTSHGVEMMICEACPNHP